jgi:tRNA nucleotidyltransferase (CCA-adding enzyme)
MLQSGQVPAAVLDVVRDIQVGGFQAYVVGGCVRDLLRGQQPKDFDVATSGKPEDIQRLFRKVIPTGIAHGTVTVVHRGIHVEVTTFRSEAEYLDGRRPSKVEFHEDIEADLARRDFTINAMAWNPLDGAVVDPFGGQADLARRVVRCVRDPMDRFLEDGLRPLRAVRFATVLDFELDASTQSAISQTLHVFRKVAVERIHQEFVKLLVAPSASSGLELLARTGLLDMFLPEAAVSEFPFVGRCPAHDVVRMALVLWQTENPAEVMKRLKFPVKAAEEAAALVKYQVLPPETASPAEMRKWLARAELRRLPSLIALHHARNSISTELQFKLEAIAAANPPLNAKSLALDGQAIMKALGVGPSAAVGQATRFLVERVLEDPTLNTVPALTEALQTWSKTN